MDFIHDNVRDSFRRVVLKPSEQHSRRAIRQHRVSIHSTAHSLLSQSSLTQKNKRTNPLLDPSFHKYGEQLKPISRLQRSSLQQPLLSVPLQLPFLQQVLLLEPQLPELPFSRPNGYDESSVSQQPSPLSYRFH